MLEVFLAAWSIRGTQICVNVATVAANHSFGRIVLGFVGFVARADGRKPAVCKTIPIYPHICPCYCCWSRHFIYCREPGQTMVRTWCCQVVRGSQLTRRDTAMWSSSRSKMRRFFYHQADNGTWLVVNGCHEFWMVPEILGSCHHPLIDELHHFSEGWPNHQPGRELIGDRWCWWL